MTPVVQARPYVKYNRQTAPAQPQTFGRNSPVFPSSALDGHPGASAADGDAKTYWQPAADDAAPFWTVDMERFVNVSRLRLTMAQAAVHRLKIDVSDDQRTWRPLADLSTNDKSSAALDVTVPANTTGRFLRLQFQASVPIVPLQLSEVEIVGTLRTR